MSPKKYFINPDSPHGVAKKVILYRYLQTRFSEMLNHWKSLGKYRFIYFDAFSGPGKHDGSRGIKSKDLPFGNDTYGSPLVALEALFSAAERNGKENCNVLIIFEDINNLKTLKDNITNYLVGRKKRIDENKEEHFKACEIVPETQIKVKLTNCKKIVFTIDITFIESKFEDFSLEENLPSDFETTPAITFIDPFGFSQTPMEKVKEFVGFRKDVLITFMTSFINRFSFSKRNKEMLNELFGYENWKELNGSLSDHYRNKLKQSVKETPHDSRRSIKSISFAIKKGEKDSIPFYNLIYFTDELRSLKAMKYGMVTAKSKKNTGSSEAQENEIFFADALFSDDEPNFKPMTDVNKEADFIYAKLKERESITFGELKEWILINSPFQYHSKALKELEKKELLSVDTHGEERNMKALPPDVGVNCNDQDLPNKPFRNSWTISFHPEKTIEPSQKRRHSRSKKTISNSQQRAGNLIPTSPEEDVGPSVKKPKMPS